MATFFLLRYIFDLVFKKIILLACFFFFLVNWIMHSTKTKEDKQLGQDKAWSDKDHRGPKHKS